MLLQQQMIERVGVLCGTDPLLDAALTYGSFPQGEADQYSDIEFWLFFTEPVDPYEWCEQVGPLRLVAVNEFGTHVALFANGVRGEFHFASVDDIAGVAAWPGLGAGIDDVIVVDRRGALRAALVDVAERRPGPGGADDIGNLCARFAAWLAFGLAVLDRGEVLRAHEILGILHRHLLWMARVETQHLEHWPTPSRAAEQDLPAEVIDRLTATTAAAERAALQGAYRAAAAWGAELAASLASTHGTNDVSAVIEDLATR